MSSCVLKPTASAVRTPSAAPSSTEPLASAAAKHTTGTRCAAARASSASHSNRGVASLCVQKKKSETLVELSCRHIPSAPTCLPCSCSLWTPQGTNQPATQVALRPSQGHQVQVLNSAERGVPASSGQELETRLHTISRRSGALGGRSARVLALTPMTRPASRSSVLALAIRSGNVNCVMVEHTLRQAPHPIQRGYS